MHFPPEESPIYWIGGWVSPRVGLDAVQKRKTLSFLGIKPQFLGSPTHGLVSTVTELSLFLLLKCEISNNEVWGNARSKNMATTQPCPPEEIPTGLSQHFKYKLA
jgi:hypothetical protein